MILFSVLSVGYKSHCDNINELINECDACTHELVHMGKRGSK